ncbi:cold-shock protein [Planococcus sp. CAU13]|uniref:cold-shock protein n=1 Tax=Planococcus sp. CAU13 TaxID=1541197 RepID=UPI00052FEF58|nr:cold shock domain-containing protein [Planococcus sp. CAU13]
MSEEIGSGTGEVKSFDADKGYGYIVGEDGEEFFFESISISNDFGALLPGQKVNFNIYEGNPERERVATNITLHF